MTRGTADPIGELLTRGVDDLVFPGAVWAVGGPDGTRSWGATGLLDPADPRAPMAPDTVFDLASLTKIIVVWSTIGALWEAGDIGLEDSLATHLPEVRGHDLADVTVIQLLTHTAGVPSRANLRALYGTDRSAIERGILHEPLSRPPGQTVEYTDRAALILGFLAERVAAMPLDELSRVCAWDALHMMSTRFSPLSPDFVGRCAPTEFDPDHGGHLKGIPHDYSARLLGVCGSAGAFSVVADLAAFLRYLVAPDQAPRRPGFGPAWIKESLKIRTANLTPSRGLFWHPASADDNDVWAHFGFTGTGLWVSPRRGRWAVLLTNKLFYTRASDPLNAIRREFCRLAFDV
ncbi:serine hydrolase domain-containing protein [Haloactinopolyspora sp.]|uniref:serine hydrolase domain-containing protein n=1 Tax=Haloactinopolyspora sp. TaxID=1966353 RepID=UPI002610ACCB|nr:serine hydrolase domain-containing protein [Haloactinopolyspora sp.]